MFDRTHARALSLGLSVVTTLFMLVAIDQLSLLEPQGQQMAAAQPASAPTTTTLGQPTLRASRS